MKKVGRPKILNKRRPFECGCGNNFIKAKELYLHFKQIHLNKIPLGSYKKKKVGRPKIL